MYSHCLQHQKQREDSKKLWFNFNVFQGKTEAKDEVEWVEFQLKLVQQSNELSRQGYDTVEVYN